MKAYQVVLVDGDGASFEEFVTPKVFIDKTKAEAYKQFFIDEDAGWWKVYVKEVKLVE
jgi:hypothetical protein